MTSLRPFLPEDLLRLGLPNLDPLTENYDLGFYAQYLITWPELFTVAEDVNGDIIGYSMSSFPHPISLLAPLLISPASCRRSKSATDRPEQ